MFVTVRHEGFHQYLHALLGTDVPVWLNEGLAEYYERAQRRIGGVKAAERNAVHQHTLSKTQRVPLREFVGITRRAFYSRAQLHYAEAWALVRLLRDPKAGYLPVFEKLIAGLRAGKSGEVAVKAAFDQVEFRKLEQAFAQSLRL